MVFVPALEPGQNPGQKPGQKSGQKPSQKSGQKSGRKSGHADHVLKIQQYIKKTYRNLGIRNLTQTSY